ncbi:MAG: DUF998 domain-containing protein [Candidatus Bathyarchaeota archaeon]|nr:DUF998 domain-containing protein [Candidatus Bathyarchaeota archaeon]
MLRKTLLICGTASSLLYIGVDFIAGTLWEGYSFTNQAVSELSAIGAPTRQLVVPIYFIYDLLMIAFGYGVWKGSEKKSQHYAGASLMGIGLLGILGVPFPLQLGVDEASFTNTMHSVFAGVTVLFFLLAMWFGSFVDGKWFRVYSIGTISGEILVGALMGYMAGTKISAQGFTTPPNLFGLIERINIYGSMIWVIILSLVLLQINEDQTNTRK